MGEKEDQGDLEDVAEDVEGADEGTAFVAFWWDGGANFLNCVGWKGEGVTVCVDEL